MTVLWRSSQAGAGAPMTRERTDAATGRWSRVPIAVGAVGGIAAAAAAAARWKRRTIRRLWQEGRVARTAAGPVEYVIAGSGAPVVVFHATPGGYDQGLAFGRMIDHGLRVIAPSRPGYLGTPLAAGRRPEEQADAVAALLDALSVPRVAVLGASGGGPAALWFALRFPDRVTRLVLWQAVTRRVRLDPRAIGGGLMSTAPGAWAMLSSIRVAPRWLLPASVRSDPEGRRRLLALVSTMVPVDVRRIGIQNDAAWIDALPELPLADITAPTLIVHGSRDTHVPYEDARAAAQRIPGARLVTIEGGTHDTVFVDRKAIRAIAGFLGGSVAGQGPAPDPPAPAATVRPTRAGRTSRSWRSRGSVLSSHSAWSVLSWASALSAASAASLLSVGSFASILSVGSSGSILSIGSSNSILGIGSSRGRRASR